MIAPDLVTAIKILPQGEIINYWSSNRLDQFEQISWLLSSSGPIFAIGPMDSLYSELIIYFGPISLAFFYFLIINRNFFDKLPFYRPHYAVCVIAILGASEGILMKITPILLFLAFLLILESKDKINIYQAKNL